MKIYITHSSSFDFKNELYTPFRRSKLNIEHEIFLPHENDESTNTKDIIKKSDIVIAEVSFPAMGEGIELGWANDANVKIICVSRENSKIPGSLKIVCNTFLVYSSSDDMINKVSEVIGKLVI